MVCCLASTSLSFLVVFPRCLFSLSRQDIFSWWLFSLLHHVVSCSVCLSLCCLLPFLSLLSSACRCSAGPSSLLSYLIASPSLLRVSLSSLIVDGLLYMCLQVSSHTMNRAIRHNYAGPCDTNTWIVCWVLSAFTRASGKPFWSLKVGTRFRQSWHSWWTATNIVYGSTPYPVRHHTIQYMCQ